MQVIYEKTFFKDVKKNSNKSINYKLLDMIELLKNSEDLKILNSVKKMTGYKDYYRIRIGDYRIGLKHQDNKIILIRLLHRKDIYKNFP